MNICVKLSFLNCEKELICEKFLNISQVNTCDEIEIPSNTTFIYIFASIITIHVNTCINIKFYNHINELIALNYLELHESDLNYMNCEIPPNSMSVIVCCICDYKLCENCV